MAVLVLGGAGYIGSHTAYELIDSGAEVVIADNLETGHREAVHPQARFYQGDIRDRAFLDGLFEKERIDCVIHFAANSLVGESMVKPLKYYDNNLCAVSYTHLDVYKRQEYYRSSGVRQGPFAAGRSPPSSKAAQAERRLPKTLPRRAGARNTRP